ncbi:MAG: TlpA family protein disulfide reductase [Planctomycetes bacterium]|nr:TlpA family protein disulfide reductase [Planctomycetota bacterium]MCB9909772.1 TlpA family protein disulfide reductase [Planctomycetota bacterium]MCB9912319.1 TlpA family protein disulfide reductase [Planctomycetota bacterium]
MSERFADQGLVIIGVHSTRGGENAAEFVQQQGLPYPVAIDIDNKTTSAYHIDGFPDYYLIDRSGKVRVADLANGDVERAVAVLIAEPAPPSIHPALAEASRKAQDKRKRILVFWGAAERQNELLARMNQLPQANRVLSNEFEVVRPDAVAQAELLPLCPSILEERALSVLDAQGNQVAEAIWSELEGPGLEAFLKTHKPQTLDAEQLWAQALKQAQRENKRVLVHLGAPW